MAYKINKFYCVTIKLELPEIEDVKVKGSWRLKIPLIGKDFENEMTVKKEGLRSKILIKKSREYTDFLKENIQGINYSNIEDFGYLKELRPHITLHIHLSSLEDTKEMCKRLEEKKEILKLHQEKPIDSILYKEMPEESLILDPSDEANYLYDYQSYKSNILSEEFLSLERRLLPYEKIWEKINNASYNETFNKEDLSEELLLQKGKMITYGNRVVLENGFSKKFNGVNVRVMGFGFLEISANTHDISKIEELVYKVEKAHKKFLKT